jgi:hypothetical protein
MYELDLIFTFCLLCDPQKLSPLISLMTFHIIFSSAKNCFASTTVFWHGYVLREEGTHCILLIAHIALCKSRLTPAHCIWLIVHLTSYTLHLTSYVLHLTPYTLHLTPYALRLTSYTLRLTSYILRLTPYVLRRTSYILYLISYRILYRVTCIRLVCKTSVIRCFYHKAETVNFYVCNITLVAISLWRRSFHPSVMIIWCIQVWTMNT